MYNRTTWAGAKARDGHRVVFSLGELDPAFRDNEILLADSADGKPLFDDRRRLPQGDTGAQGPVRLVVPHDGPGARSIRVLTELEVIRLGK